MKVLMRVIALTVCVLALAFSSGCSKTGSDASAKFSDEFKSNPALKARADLVASSFKTNGFMVAIVNLKEMRAVPTLSSKQDEVVVNMLEVVMTELARQVAKGDAAAIQAQKDLNELRRR